MAVGTKTGVTAPRSERTPEAGKDFREGSLSCLLREGSLPTLR